MWEAISVLLVVAVVAGLAFVLKTKVDQICEENRLAPKRFRIRRLQPHRDTIKRWVHEALAVAHRPAEIPWLHMPPDSGPLHRRGGFDPEEMGSRAQRECRAIIKRGYPDRPWHEASELLFFGAVTEFIKEELHDTFPNLVRRPDRQIMDLLDAHHKYERKLWSKAILFYKAMARVNALSQIDVMKAPDLGPAKYRHILDLFQEGLHVLASEPLKRQVFLEPPKESPRSKKSHLPATTAEVS